jgi:hypothetical protein
VDLLGVVPRDRNLAKETAEEGGPRIGNLVEDEPRLRELGEDRQKTGAGGGFQNDVGRSEGRGLGCYKAERDRRRELLEALGFLRTGASA